VLQAKSVAEFMDQRQERKRLCNWAAGEVFGSISTERVMGTNELPSRVTIAERAVGPPMAITPLEDR